MALYRRLPYAGEVELFARFVAPGASILELGCGVGRITRALLDRGLRVTAVDNSAAMLECVPAPATTVLADIESLDLHATFDVVLFASCLINTLGPEMPRTFLDACRRHLAPGGVLVFERHDPAWLLGAPEGYIGTLGPVAMYLESASRQADVATLCLRYEDGERVWQHPFTVRALGDEALARSLRESGFDRPEWLDARRRWGLWRAA